MKYNNPSVKKGLFYYMVHPPSISFGADSSLDGDLTLIIILILSLGQNLLGVSIRFGQRRELRFDDPH